MPTTMHPHPFHCSPPFGRRVAAVVVGGLCFAAAVAIWGLIVGRFDSTSARVLGSALAAAVATLCGMAGSTLLTSAAARRAVGIATIAVSAIALALALIVIWVPVADSDTLYRAIGVTLPALIAGAHASLLLHWLREDDDTAVRRLVGVAITSASSAALLVCGLVLFAREEVAAGVWRLLGVIVVIAVLATLLAPLTRRIHSSR